MAYNLDFSGWKDARNAMSNSIINQANIAANMIANRANVWNKAISTGIGVAGRMWDNYQKKKEKEEADKLIAANTGLLPDELPTDAAQELSANNKLPEDMTPEEAAALKKFLIEKYNI